jgi:3'-phosphoadenosine 5'-phosphosulfate sulfotransferase (PAPS reductase)/FAD synthetase
LIDDWLGRWREYFRAWYDEGRVEENALEVADFASRFLDEGQVSVSGGKDSMVMLHIIVTRCRPDIVVFHWDHGPWLMPRVIEDEIRRNIATVASKAKVIVETYNYGSRPEARVVWRPWYKAFFSTLKRLGYKYHLLGIRAEESSRRRARGRVVERRHWVEIHPIYNFTWRDVWAYIFKHNIPVPNIYYKYARLLGWNRVRLTTLFDIEMQRYGQPQIDSVLSWRWKHNPLGNRTNSAL